MRDESRMIRSLMLAAMLATLALACSSDPGGADAGTEPRVEVGGGGSQFVPLFAESRDGGYDEVEIIAGPQGGYHIFMSVRAWNLEPEGLITTRTVSLVEPREVLSETEAELSLLQNGDAWEWSGLLGFVPDPNVASDKLVELKIHVKDVNGQEASDSRIVTARFH